MQSALELSLQTTATNLSSHPTAQQDLRTLALSRLPSRKLQPTMKSSSSLSESSRKRSGRGCKVNDSTNFRNHDLFFMVRLHY
jgi:hypothetical protein